MSDFEKIRSVFGIIILFLMCLGLGYIARLILNDKDLKIKSTTENIFYNFIVGFILFGILMLANYIGCSGNIPMKP